MYNACGLHQAKFLVGYRMEQISYWISYENNGVMICDTLSAPMTLWGNTPVDSPSRRTSTAQFLSSCGVGLNKTVELPVSWDVKTLLNRQKHVYIYMIHAVVYLQWIYREETLQSYRCNAGLILGLRPANERWRYFVTTSLIGWAQVKNQTWNIFSRWLKISAFSIVLTNW